MTRKAMYIFVILTVLLAPYVAHAGTASGVFKWESTLSQIKDSLSGPVAGAIAIVAIVLFGLGLALSEGGAIRVVLGILLGLSIAASAPSLVTGFFGFANGSML